jgi:hypothetical protein
MVLFLSRIDAFSDKFSTTTCWKIAYDVLHNIRETLGIPAGIRDS